MFIKEGLATVEPLEIVEPLVMVSVLPAVKVMAVDAAFPVPRVELTPAVPPVPPTVMLAFRLIVPNAKEPELMDPLVFSPRLPPLMFGTVVPIATAPPAVPPPLLPALT